MRLCFLTNLCTKILRMTSNVRMLGFGEVIDWGNGTVRHFFQDQCCDTNSSNQKKQEITPRKTNMTMEKQPFECISY